MTRVVAGAARGRRLSVPPGRTTRPTSDRAREALFSALEAMLGTLAGRRFADLYAGSGAVGLEALSRGAAHVLLVEDDRGALAALRANVTAVGIPGAVVLAGDVGRAAGSGDPGAPYDVVFLDPPYAVPDDEVGAVLSDLSAGGWLVPGAVVVVERETRGGPFGWPEGFAADRDRRYGEGTLWYGRAAGSGGAGAGAGPAGPAA